MSDKSIVQRSLEHGFRKIGLDDQSIDDWFYYLTRDSFKSEYPKYSMMGRILMKIKNFPSQNVPFMGVGLNDGNYALYYNPEWMDEEATKEDVMYAMAHESYHILLKHIPRTAKRIAITPKDQIQLVNDIYGIGADYAINGMLADDFGDAIKEANTLSKAYYPQDAGLPRNRSMEQYAELMLRQKEDIQKQIQVWKKEAKNSDGDEEESSKNPFMGGDPTKKQEKGMSQTEKIARDIIDHRQNNQHPWGDSNKQSGEEEEDEQSNDKQQQGPRNQPKQPTPEQSSPDPAPLNEETRVEDPGEIKSMAEDLNHKSDSLLKQASKEEQNGRGKMPANLAEKYEEQKQEERTVPWEDLMGNRIYSSMSQKFESDYTKPMENQYITHRVTDDGIEKLDRFLPMYPRRTREEEFVAIYAMDSSGSVREKDFHIGLNKVASIVRDVDNMKVIAVQCGAEIKDIEVLTEKNIGEYDTRVGYGGTKFDEPFELGMLIDNGGDIPDKWNDFREDINKAMRLTNKVDTLIYHTDGIAPVPDVNPDFQTIWCIAGSRDLPGIDRDSEKIFGEVISYDSQGGVK